MVARYTVIAEKSGTWWSLQCVEVPGAMSQVKSLDDAHTIAEAIAFVAEVPETEINLTIQPVLPFSIRTAETTGIHHRTGEQYR